jgi:hypothetical protein
MKALFAIRHNNDFDSMAPVVDGWVSRSPGHAALVYFASAAVKWRGDFRTRMLEKTGRVRFADPWLVAGGNGGGALPRLWHRNRADDRLQRKLLQFATELRVLPGFTAKMNRLLDEYRPDIVAFDWYDVPARRKMLQFFGYGEMLDWARKHRRPLVSLPHGLLLYSQPGMAKPVFTTDYDAIYVESESKRELLQGGASNVVVTGSPRYEPKWVSRVAEALETNSAWPSEAPGKTRIVFFATTAKGYYDFSKLLDWISHLAGHPEVELVVQPHPRGQKDYEFASIAGLENVRIDSATPASGLIARADIASTLVSSVVVEAAVRGKEILFPKFLTTVTTQFDDAHACISLGNLEGTYPAIDAFRAGKRVPRRYYQAFLKRSVYGGGSPDTIGRVCRHMQKLAQATAEG